MSELVGHIESSGDLKATLTPNQVLMQVEMTNGARGKSAYEVWLAAGNTGTIEDFILSIKGDRGDNAYHVWLAMGNTGTEQDFLNALTSDVNGRITELQRTSIALAIALG